jgi:hypothetical protein
MKISIGSSTDKNIWDIVQSNIENGYTVYSDNRDYYVDVLSDDNVYRSEDAQFQHMPSGMYVIKNNTVYMVDNVQTWINL